MLRIRFILIVLVFVVWLVVSDGLELTHLKANKPDPHNHIKIVLITPPSDVTGTLNVSLPQVTATMTASQLAR